MKKGDLVRCKDTKELAVVLDSYFAGNETWVVGFWQDCTVSATTKDNLEVVNESR